MARVRFGTRLRSLRERAGMSQTQLAEKVGVSQGNVATWERNAAVPPADMVARLAAALGATSAKLTQPSGLFIPVSEWKRTIRLTKDNFAAHLSTDYAASRVKGYTVPADGIDPDDW